MCVHLPAAGRKGPQTHCTCNYRGLEVTRYEKLGMEPQPSTKAAIFNHRIIPLQPVIGFLNAGLSDCGKI